MSTTPRFLALGTALGLAAGLLLGLGLTQPGRAAATSPSAAPRVPSTGGAIGAPAALPAITTGGTTGTMVASSGTAVGYPYFPGSPGVAPDHTIVVAGVGQAEMQSDGSDRAAAEKTALGMALTDAKTQATEIASATGLSISGVLSVSASVSPSYGIVLMAGPSSASGTPTCVPGAPVGGAQPTANPLLQPVCPPLSQPVYRQSISVSVTVEYRVTGGPS